MSFKVHHLFQRQNSSTISVKAIHTSRTAFCKGFQIKWRASFVSSITSTQLVDNLLGKGQATVILRDSSQQQAQLWICFIFKSHSQCRSCTSWIVPFTYTVIMLKNHSNRYKRKRTPISICTLRALLHRHTCPILKKGQLISGFTIYVQLGASSRTVQPKQLPKSQHIFSKRSSALGLTSSTSKGIWPTIYSVWQSSGNMNSFS